MNLTVAWISIFTINGSNSSVWEQVFFQTLHLVKGRPDRSLYSNKGGKGTILQSHKMTLEGFVRDGWKTIIHKVDNWTKSMLVKDGSLWRGFWYFGFENLCHLFYLCFIYLFYTYITPLFHSNFSGDSKV